MWHYVQRTGEVFADTGELIAYGYAGFGEHKNRPESEHLRNKGPLPRGRYTIGPPRATQSHGPYVLRLQPAPTNIMHGRAGFLIHGDSVAFPGTASNGCLILQRRIREQVWSSGDHALTVVAEPTELRSEP